MFLFLFCITQDSEPNTLPTELFRPRKAKRTKTRMANIPENSRTVAPATSRPVKVCTKPPQAKKRDRRRLFFQIPIHTIYGPSHKVFLLLNEVGFVFVFEFSYSCHLRCLLLSACLSASLTQSIPPPLPSLSLSLSLSHTHTHSGFRRSRTCQKCSAFSLDFQCDTCVTCDYFMCEDSSRDAPCGESTVCNYVALDVSK